MTPVDEIAEWDAVETAERIRKREISAREVIDAAIVRAERALGLGAIVTPAFEAARQAAGEAKGLLAGVPTFIKDLVPVAGVRATWGSAAVGTFVPKRSERSVARFLATGVVCLGKSATSEFGLSATTEPLGRAPCRNPWAPAYSTGGSSGGAGCLVAAGVVPLAHASDGGGSIRIPASCCGLVGLKPSRKRFDMDGSQLLPVNVAVQGVVSRTVRDTVAFFRGLEARAPTCEPIGEPRAEPGRKLRIGLHVEMPLGAPVHPECRGAAECVAKLCERLGHHVEIIARPFEGQVIEDFFRLLGLFGFAYTHLGKLITHRGLDRSKLEPWTLGLSRYFLSELGASFAGIHRLRRFTDAYARAMDRFDVLLSPTLAEPPPLLGYLRTDLPFEVSFERLVRFVGFTAVQNIAGAPAISLPLERSSEGLPIGVQFGARLGDDRTLLELALQLEAAQPWERLASQARWGMAC